jgi:hypothetical protein
MQPRVYVETTIPSFYYDTRSTPAIVARREWTRKWWVDAHLQYELVSSPAVVRELQDGPPDRQANWLSLIQGLSMLPIEPPIAAIAITFPPEQSDA